MHSLKFSNLYSILLYVSLENPYYHQNYLFTFLFITSIAITSTFYDGLVIGIYSGFYYNVWYFEIINFSDVIKIIFKGSSVELYL